VTRSRRASLLALALLASSCGRPLVKLPSGAGTPAPVPESIESLQQASADCRSIKTLTAEIAISGSVGGERVRVRLLAGVAAPASARIEATASFGAPYFVFVATGRDATLLLPRDRRVLEHGEPEAVLEAIAGIPLTASDLERALTGCPLAEERVKSASQFGDTWKRLSTEGGDVYISRGNPGAPWRISAATTPGWRIDYPDRRAGVPASIRLVSLDANGKAGTRFDLALALTQVETNVPLDASAFRVEIPGGAVPITLDELRHARPGVRQD
jgi:hypothetical protein